MDVSDSELLEIALVENLQRKDLTPFEEADGYVALQDRHGYTHEQIANAVGKSRVTVTEALSIAKLPAPVSGGMSARRHRVEVVPPRARPPPLAGLMLDAVRAWVAGEQISRDDLRTAKREGGAASGAGRSGAYRKTFALDFVPDDGRYKVSLVFLGRGQKKSDVLAAIRDLARRIERGEIDLEGEGRFVKPKKAGEKPAPRTKKLAPIERAASRDRHYSAVPNFVRVAPRYI